LGLILAKPIYLRAGVGLVNTPAPSAETLMDTGRTPHLLPLPPAFYSPEKCGIIEWNNNGIIME
jgi:hypothetical protein